MLFIYLVSNVSPTGGCLADSDVAAMVYMLTQRDGLALTGRTGSVGCVIQYRMLRTSSISCLIVQSTVTLEPWPSVNQMHVEDLLETGFLIGNAYYLAELTYTEQCLLAP